MAGFLLTVHFNDEVGHQRPKVLKETFALINSNSNCCFLKQAYICLSWSLKQSATTKLSTWGQYCQGCGTLQRQKTNCASLVRKNDYVDCKTWPNKKNKCRSLWANYALTWFSHITVRLKNKGDHILPKKQTKKINMTCFVKKKKNIKDAL